MARSLGEVLRRLCSALRNAGEGRSAQDLGELQFAAAAAAEMMAAFERGDHEAVAFHLELLARQVENPRNPGFRTSEE
ncbi:hypothetical protein [Lentzea albida]|uniref:FCD domain-containing protein n=1 Tax=Lentzea albida TaxID=65499 RepID=A0A1H9PUM2_9PSEU|nr:hypothetical protein [Lentzea albida]SER51535.1 hypothetical protein SAMN04488000_109253 [Lentzea albida]